MDRFSPKHFAFVILGTAIVSLKTYPNTFIQHGMRDSSIGIIIASALIFVFFMYMINIWKNNGKPGIVELYQTAVGKFLGNILLIMFILMLFITLVESASIEADSMHKNMFIETPAWYYLVFFLVPAIYTIQKDIVAIITVTMIGIILIMLAGINLSILTASQKRFSLLFPLFENGITWGFIISIVKMFGLYGSISISLPYLSKINDKNNKMNKYILIGLIILIQMEIVSVTGTLATFTPEAISNMPYPKLLQTQLVSHLQFLEFGELYVMLQILGGWLIKYLLTFYSMLLILRQLRVSRKILNISTYVISALVFISAFYITKHYILMLKFLNLYEYLSVINFIVIPLSVFTIFKFRQKKVNLKNK